MQQNKQHTYHRHYYRKENVAIKNKIFLIMQNSITIHCEWRMWLFTAKQDLKIKKSNCIKYCREHSTRQAVYN